MNVEIVYKGDEFKLLLDGLPHIVIKDRIIGFQSWNKENKWFEIEFYTKNKTILAQYDCIIKWTQILTKLNEL